MSAERRRRCERKQRASKLLLPRMRSSPVSMSARGWRSRMMARRRRTIVMAGKQGTSMMTRERRSPTAVRQARVIEVTGGCRTTEAMREHRARQWQAATHLRRLEDDHSLQATPRADRVFRTRCRTVRHIYTASRRGNSKVLYLVKW